MAKVSRRWKGQERRSFFLRRLSSCVLGAGQRSAWGSQRRGGLGGGFHWGRPFEAASGAWGAGAGFALGDALPGGFGGVVVCATNTAGSKRSVRSICLG